MEELTAEERRVLGCLVEKEATTPEQYPLSLNALVLACNQSTNREPVVVHEPDTVIDALSSLRERKLTRVMHPAHGRVTKYRHVLDEVWALTREELAVVAVLLLRGPQTLNELRTRTERYGGDPADLGGTEGILDRLAARPEPLVVRIERRPGQREERWASLLGGSLEWEEPSAAAGGGSRRGRIDELEATVAELRSEVDELRADLADLRVRLGDLLGP